jgi:hypothetical protein
MVLLIFGIKSPVFPAIFLNLNIDAPDFVFQRSLLGLRRQHFGPGGRGADRRAVDAGQEVQAQQDEDAQSVGHQGDPEAQERFHVMVSINFFPSGFGFFHIRVSCYDFSPYIFGKIEAARASKMQLCME